MSASVDLQTVIGDMVQHAVHHDDVGAGEFAGGGRIEMSGNETCRDGRTIAVHRRYRSRRCRSRYNRTFRQMVQDMAGPASDIDHPHSRPQRQVIRYRLDAGAEEATGILIGLVERGMAQDHRLHQEASS